MEERELNHWLDALLEQGLIGEWHWDLKIELGHPAVMRYFINGKPYTPEGAVKLVRDFEAACVRA